MRCLRPKGRPMTISSPARSRRCGFACWPLTSILPPLQAFCASDRVLNRHATSSQMSSRTPATACNVIVTLVSLFLVFRIGVILSGDENAALAGATAYAFLVNSNVYLRHLLPYDWALSVGLIALWLSLTRPRTNVLAVVTGALTGVVLTIYTGSYSLCGVLGVAILWEPWECAASRREAARLAVLCGA